MNSYKFINNRSCKYFPCHEGIKKRDFNCMFCFCPLYALGDSCGGNFVRTENGIKDCSKCKLPHIRKNYEYIIEKSMLLIDLVKTETSTSNASEQEE